MLLPMLIMAANVTYTAPMVEELGTIRGVVVNGSRGDSPLGGVEVVLRVRLGGEMAVVADTTADGDGVFQFRGLPLDADVQYLPGASHREVHYPGPRVRLTTKERIADVKLTVYDAVSDPSPLVISQSDIVIRPLADSLEVSESLVIDNPSLYSYIGTAAKKGGHATTLQLAVPSDFTRITFAKEFFGRNFKLIDQKLVTDIPWPPGRRELKYTYILANDQRRRIWRRALELPCARARLTGLNSKPKEVTCTLPPVTSAEGRQVCFESVGDGLSQGDEIRVTLGGLAVRPLAYGRWIALSMLSVIIVGASLVLVWRTVRPDRSRSRGPVVPSTSLR